MSHETQTNIPKETSARLRACLWFAVAFHTAALLGSVLSSFAGTGAFHQSHLIVSFVCIVLIGALSLAVRFIQNANWVALGLHFIWTVPYAFEAAFLGSSARESWLLLVLAHASASLFIPSSLKKAQVCLSVLIGSIFAGHALDPDLKTFVFQATLTALAVTGFSLFDAVRFQPAHARQSLESEIPRALYVSDDEIGLRILSHDVANIVSVMRDSLEAGIEEIDANEGKLNERARGSIDDCRFAITQSIGMLAAVRDDIGIRSGKIDARSEEFYVHDVIKDVIQLWQRHARHKKISIALSSLLKREDTRVFGNRAIFAHTIIGNLLTNAIKFSPLKGLVTVTLSVNEADGQLRVEIRDQGTGISEDRVATLFDDNSRTSTKGTAGETGTGFGLPLVKSSLGLFGGSIQISSHASATGMGTSFVCSLPCATAMESDAPRTLPKSA